MVGRHLSRAALPDAVSSALRPFVDRIKEKYDKASAEGRCLALIGSLRVEATPDLDADAPDLRCS